MLRGGIEIRTMMVEKNIVLTMHATLPVWGVPKCETLPRKKALSPDGCAEPVTSGMLALFRGQTELTKRFGVILPQNTIYLEVIAHVFQI